MLFDKQYILTETVTTETRYRTETRTDSEGNEYEVEAVSYTHLDVYKRQPSPSTGPSAGLPGISWTSSTFC